MTVRKGLFAVLTLIVVLVVSGGYVVGPVLGVDPTRQTYRVEVMMDDSRGLMDTSPVTLHGMAVGNVRAITPSAEGLAVELELDSATSIPADSLVAVQNLSAAGEQYLDFRPNGTEGPYLTAGDRIPVDQVIDVGTVGDVTSQLDRLGELIDPGAVRRLGDLLVQLASDRVTLDNMKAIVELMAATVHDRAPNIGRLFRSGQLLETRLMAIDTPALLTKLTPVLKQLGPALSEVVVALGEFGATEGKTGALNHQIGPVLEKLEVEIGAFLPYLGAFAAALTPVTGQLRGIRVNAGAFMDMWAATFPGDGPARVELTVQ